MINHLDIYAQPSIYDDQYWWKKDDIEFYKNIIPEKSTVLELGSGTGRLAFPLIRNNINYYGLELSKEFCTYSQKKLNQIGLQNHIYQGNMVSFKIPIKFDCIFIAFNTFLHLLTNKEAETCLKCVKEHLKPNGEFIIDILVPHPEFLYKENNSKNPVMDFKDSIRNELVEIYEACIYDRDTEICDITWIYKYSNESKEFNYKMKMYYPDTINRILTDCGFYIKELYGDYSMRNFSDESHMQIYVCTI